jgi:hypothetical protein
MPYRWTLTDLIAPYVGSEILTKDPIGWDEAVINMARSEKYKGMNTLYTNSLKFHCNGGGKEYVDAIYESEGIDGRINILIEYDCDDSGTYDTLFDGIVNLASYKTDGEYTTCNIEQSDLHTKLAMRDEISVDLESTTSIGGSPITAPGAKNISMHSQNLYFKSSSDGDVPFTATILNDFSDSFTHRGLFSHTIPTTRSEAQQYLGWNEYDDFGDPGATKNTSQIPEIFSAIDTNIQFPATYTYNLQFKGVFTDTVTAIATRSNTAHNLILAWGANLNDAQSTGLYISGGYTMTTASENVNFDTTELTGNITLNFGDKVWLYWFESELMSVGPYSDTIEYKWDYEIANFLIEINSTTDESFSKSFLVHEAFGQVSDSIADGDNHFYSDFYGRVDSSKVSYLSDGCGSPIAITTGLNIRSFPDKKIATSFKQLFENFDCLHNIGMAIENNRIRVEPLSYWFDSNTQIISLPNVNSYEQKCDNKRFINKIDIGYQKWESEFRGGLDEINTKREYSTIISSVKNKLNKLCSFIASGYTIEFTRRKRYTDETTTDWRYDNDLFFLSVKKYFSGSIYFVENTPPNDDLIQLNGSLVYGINPGDTIVISGTPSNDGSYTVSSVSIGLYSTDIRVLESVVTELNVNGNLEDITSPIYFTEKYADSFSYGSGMTSLLTAYNLRLTPARMLLAHFNVITAGLQIIRGLIKFVKGEGNTSLSVAKDIIAYTDQCQEDYASQLLTESQSFQWNDSNVKNVSPLWLPETYSFEYPLSYSEFKAIKANPYGYVSFYKNAADIKAGFIMSMEYRIKSGLTKFELLRKY